MGRGGGSHGGHSGGHGRSHYSSSHRSSSSSSSHRSTSRSYSSSRSYGPSYSSRRTTVYHTGGYYGGSAYGGTAVPRTIDPLAKYKSALIFWNVGVITVLLALFAFLFNGNITPSSRVREPLQANQCIESSQWYEDHDGTWIYNSGELISGMRAFYKTTGIQPYLIIDTGNINGNDRPSAQEYEDYLMSIYEEKFSDGGHLILGFNEPEPSSYGMYYVIGDEAKAIFDDECGEILFDYIDHYYTYDTDSLSDEQLFSYSFEKTAKRMMKKSFTTLQALTIVIVVVLLGNIVIFTLFGMAVYKKKKAESDREVAHVINSDIKDVVDDSLKDKYLQD